MVEKKKSLLDTVYCPNLLLSDISTEAIKNGWKWRFPVATSSKTKRKDVSLGGAASGSIVLDAVLEKDKHSYVQVISFSLPQSDFFT